jgi:SAM-dependent methyltransferase
MDPAFEERYLRVEETQWWCRARRDFVRRLVHESAPDRCARILEIGCSGGVLLQQLSDDGYHNVQGVDISVSAVSAARARNVQNVAVMDASSLTFDNNSFDFVIASDVLEHLKSSIEALTNWRRVLAPAGKLIVFVPAFQFLWSSHDEANRHFRRYSARQLRDELNRAGFAVQRLSYWNALLTVPGFMLQMAERAFGRSTRGSDTGGLVQPPAAVNELLYRTIALENLALRHIDLPFGTSVFAVAHAAKTPVRERA